MECFFVFFYGLISTMGVSKIDHAYWVRFFKQIQVLKTPVQVKSATHCTVEVTLVYSIAM